MEHAADEKETPGTKINDERADVQQEPECRKIAVLPCVASESFACALVCFCR